MTHRTRVRPDWERLRCLVEGELCLPGTPGYAMGSEPAVARFDAGRPSAVVLAASVHDVAATIRFAERNRLRISPRSGGHCFAGRSLLGEVVVDVTPMREVSVTDGRVMVGAGTRLGDLDDALGAAGRALPTGCGRSVGIAGLTLGGGLGILGRRHGLTCDQLKRARVVLADGRIIDCDDRHHSDLFWALRGAGGGQFGVVTSLEFATVPAPPTTCFHLTWPATHAEAAVAAWQRWAPTAADDVNAELRLTAPAHPGRPPVVELVGAILGGARGVPADEAPTAGQMLDDFIGRVGAQPATASRRTMNYRDAKRHLAGLPATAVTTGNRSGTSEDAGDSRDGGGPMGPSRAWPELSRSEFFRQRLPRHAIAALLDNLTAGRTPGQSRHLNLTPWGGAYNRMPSDATAFAHRAELFLLEHVTRVQPAAAASEQQAARRWLTRSWDGVHQWGSGRVYPNFPDPDLDDWASAYHANNYERLRHIKRTYDPDDRFQFPQSLAQPDPRPAARTSDRPGVVLASQTRQGKPSGSGDAEDHMLDRSQPSPTDQLPGAFVQVHPDAGTPHPRGIRTEGTSR